jgi:ABC-type sugar transport system substrate-binding protein
MTLLAALEKEPLDALVVSPWPPTISRSRSPDLWRRGVKIVALDSPLPRGLANTFVRYDQKSLGEAVARYRRQL